METATRSGSVLGERYRLIRPLARGGMGSVWRAEHLALSSEVAVKVIDPRVADHDMGLARFLREARALAALHSPYIVQVIDFGSHGDTAYLVMELLEGRTLGQRLKDGGPLSPGETCRILRDVCKAIGHAHDRGIVHRDLKPDNIFLCDASREHVTKVLDFGIAKPTQVDATSHTDTEAGAFLGTPSYMSPEQCRGLRVDQRSDLWALGAIGYECLVGKRLFVGEAVGAIVLRICSDELPAFVELGHLPPGFTVWLRKALARIPAERFQSASQLSDALAAALDLPAQSAPGVDSAETLSGTLTSAGERALASKPPATLATLATLANGSLEKSARWSSRGQRTPARVAMGSAIVIGVLGLVLFLRLRATPPGAGTESLGSPEPAGSEASAATLSKVIAPSMPRPSFEGRAATQRRGERKSQPADAGARSGDAPNEPPNVLDPSPGSSAASQAPQTKPASARRKTPREMELLRRKR